MLVDIIEFLKKETGKSQGELSIGAGYAAETLAQAKAKSSGHKAVIDQLKIAYSSILKNSIYQESESVSFQMNESDNIWEKKLPDKQRELDYAKLEIDYLKKRNKDLEEMMELYRKQLEKLIEEAKKVSSGNTKTSAA